MYYWKATLFAAVALALAGCSDRKSDGAFDVYSASRGDVMAVVNGEAVRASDFFDRQRAELAFYAYGNGKRTLAAAEGDERFRSRLDKVRYQREGYILAELVNQALIGQYLAKERIDVSAEESEQTVSNSLRKINFKQSLAAFAATNGLEAATLRRHILASLRVQTAVAHFDPASTSVSEEEIDAGLKRLENYRDLAVASNAVTFATCSNVIRRVESGADFAAIGRQEGFSPEESEEWDNLVHDEFTNKEFEEWAFSAPVGSVGGPFELDDCIGVFKILDRVEGTREPSMASAEVASVRLARIAYPVIDPEPEPRTREYVRGALLKWKATQSQKELFRRLHEEMKLDYPSGTNFVYDISKPRENKQK